MQFEQLQHPLEKIMIRAGDLLLDYFNNGFTSKIKSGGGLVTNADIATEQFLKSELGALVPGAAFYAEESGRSGTGDYCWVIDPLDGTNNFAHKLPYFCISVALTYRGIAQVGAIYQPLMKELFYAQRGGGAYLNGTTTKISATRSLEQSMLLIGLPYAKDATYNRLLEKVQVLGPKSFAIRHMGAAALDCAYVASGRLDGLFLANLAWWDVAAGVLLMEEAGGMVTDFEGKLIDENYRSLVAGGPSVYQELRKLL